MLHNISIIQLELYAYCIKIILNYHKLLGTIDRHNINVPNLHQYKNFDNDKHEKICRLAEIMIYLEVHWNLAIADTIGSQKRCPL